jgi:hypothetical protein
VAIVETTFPATMSILYKILPRGLRSNALLLVVVTLVSLWSAQAQQGKSPSSAATDRVFTDRLKSLSSERGGRSMDCVKAFAKFGSVDDCARSRLEHRKPFYLAYSGPVNLPFHFSYGVAADAAGDVFSVTFHERGFPPVVLNRHMRLMDENHTRVVECIKPIKLEPTKEGWLACLTPVNGQASAIAAKQEPIDTSVCAVLADPAAFNNKLVRIRAYYWGNMENSTLNDDRCHGSLWLGFPSGSVPSPVVAYVSSGNILGSEDAEGKRILAIPVSLIQDWKFERFEKLLRLNPTEKVPLIGEPVQHVTATFVGRIDAVSPQVHEFFKNQPPLKRPMLGFGHLGGYEAELILQSVADDANVE